MPYTGKATYDNFALIGEDVSPTVKLVAARETPFLDLLGDPARAAQNIAHQWTEEQLGPDTFINSTAINSATAEGGAQINGLGGTLQVGMMLEIESNTAGAVNEVVQITSVPGANSIRFTRNFASKGVSSLAPGGTLTVIGTAELEGSTSSGDVTRARTRRTNYCQIFKKVLTVSGSDRAVMYSPDLGDEFDHQKTLRMAELVRDLEKAVFRGYTSGNSIGSATAYRTMSGLKDFLTGINSVIVASSFTADPLLYVNNILQQCWNNGARDIDVIVAGAQWKRDISGIGSTTRVIPVQQDDSRIVSHKDYIETDFGTARLVLSPWLNSSALMAIASSRVEVVPLRGRSFAYQDVAKTGDADVGHIVGEYTLEVHRPDAMGYAHI